MSKKTFEGTVTSTKMEKTIVVSVSRRYRETRTGKIMQSRKKYKVHCEDKAVKAGDLVSFVECRPLSKDKRWRFMNVTRKATIVDAVADGAN